MRLTLWAFGIVSCLLTGACRKEMVFKKPVPENPPTLDSVHKCSSQQSWNIKALKEAMTGDWKLIKIYYVGMPREADIELKILEDGKVFTYVNDTLLSERSYTLDSNVSGPLLFFRGSEYASGYVYMCGNYMILSNSYMDGDDYYYWRE